MNTMKSARKRPAAASAARPKKKALKNERLEARINKDIKDLAKRAADLKGMNFTDFVSEAIYNASQKVVKDAHIMEISLKDQIAFAQATLAPPEPSAALKRAYERHEDLLSKD